MCVRVCVCVRPVCVRGWLVLSFKSLSLLPAGGAFRGMKTVTFRSLQVKSYLSASTTGNIKYAFGYFFIRLLAGCWSLTAALDATSLDITNLELGITAAMS